MCGEVFLFSEFNLEDELVHRLEEMNKKYPIGPQKELIKVLMEKNFDVILSAKKQTGKSTGYLIPMINEGIIRKKYNHPGKCVGLIITWSSEAVKDITQLAKEICFGLPVSILYCSNKRLIYDINNEYFIIITKAVVLFNNISNFVEIFKSLSFVVVEEACYFNFVDKNKFLVEIFKIMRNTGNTSFTTILSSVDFRGTENKLIKQFLQKPLSKISLFGIGLEKHFDEQKKTTFSL